MILTKRTHRKQKDDQRDQTKLNQSLKEIKCLARISCASWEIVLKWVCYSFNHSELPIKQEHLKRVKRNRSTQFKISTWIYTQGTNEVGIKPWEVRFPQ